MMNKKAQAESILIFFVLICAIFIVSIVVLRMVNTIVDPFQAQIGNVSQQAGDAVGYTQDKFTGFWDTVIILILIVNVAILFISAFLVDVHPAFVIVYIIAVIFMFVFGNYGLSTVDAIWNAVGTSTEQAQSPMQIWVLNHIQLVLLGIVILSGILMYAKFKFFNQGQGTGGTY